MKCRIIIFLFALFAYAGSANAQTIFETKSYTDRSFSIADSSGPYAITVTHMIRTIAAGIPKKAEFTSFKCFWNEIMRIRKQGENQWEASLEITEAGCTGDMKYKGFDLSEVLFPDVIDFSIVINSPLPIKTNRLNGQGVRLQNGYNKAGSMIISDTARKPSYTMSAENIKLYYSEKARQRFDERIALINEYYSIRNTLSQCMQALESINFDDVIKLYVYDIRLKDTEKKIEEIYALDFPGKLSLTSYDPESFLEKFNDLSEKAIQMRKEMNRHISEVDLLFYKTGMIQLDSGNMQKARYFFQRAVSMNPSFAPAHLEIARMMYVRDSMIQASAVMKFVVTQTNPSPETEVTVGLFCDTLMRAMVVAGEDYTRTEKFNEALEYLLSVRELCNSSQKISCPAHLDRHIANARFGIYRSFLSVAKKAIDNEKFKLAEIYIREAETYQKKNSSDIISPSEAHLMMENLIHALVKKADTLIRRNQFTKALEFSEQAKSICDSMPQFQCPPSIETSRSAAHRGVYGQMIRKASAELSRSGTEKAFPLITDCIAYREKFSSYIHESTGTDTLLRRYHQLTYQALVAGGRKNAAAGLLLQAADMLADAADLAAKNNLRPDPKLDSLLQASASVVFSNQAYSFFELLDRDAYSQKAAEAKDKLRKDFLRYRLENHQPSKSLAEEAEKKFRLLQCKKAASISDSLATAANTAVNLMKYSEAIAIFDQALALSLQYPDCNLPSAVPAEEKARYAPAAAYQQMITAAEQAVSESNYALFSNLWQEAAAFFESKKLAAFGLHHHGMHEYAAASGKISLMLFCTDLMIQQNKGEAAFLLLKALKAKGVPANECLSLQQRAGFIYGMQDFSTSGRLRVKDRLMLLTGNDPWFAVFSKSFIRGWKTIAK